jgi:hypothetical protein
MGKSESSLTKAISNLKKPSCTGNLRLGGEGVENEYL